MQEACVATGRGACGTCRDCVLDPQWETRYEDRWEEIWQRTGARSHQPRKCRSSETQALQYSCTGMKFLKHRCRARVQSLDNRTRATRRSAAVASYLALRIEVEGAQRGAQEILLRMRTAARDRRRAVIARRMLGHMGHSRAGYGGQVRLRLVGGTPPRRSRIRAAASEAAANSGPIGTANSGPIGIQSGEEGQWSGTDASPALSLPPSFAD